MMSSACDICSKPSRKIRHFVSDKTRRDLDQDEVLTLALVRLIEIIGEAAANITDETRAANPTIPWLDIVGTRNRMIHGYFAVDLNVIWDTITLNIPALIEQLEHILPPDMHDDT